MESPEVNTTIDLVFLYSRAEVTAYSMMKSDISKKHFGESLLAAYYVLFQ